MNKDCFDKYCTKCHIINILNYIKNNNQSNIKDVIDNTLIKNEKEYTFPNNQFSFYKMINTYIELENNLINQELYDNEIKKNTLEVFISTIEGLHNNCSYIKNYQKFI